MCDANGERAFLLRMLAAIAASGLALLAGCGTTERGAQNKWTLKGTEILVELQVDAWQLRESGARYQPGIYALDAFAKDAKPQLLIAGASRPVWSPKRDRFAYVRGNSIFVSLTSGASTLVDAEAGRQLGPSSPPLRWMSDGQGSVICRRWGTGTVVRHLYLGREGIAMSGPGPQFTIGPRVAKHPHEVPGWDHILSIRDADSSPDASGVALEISPSAPDDLLGSRSKIYVYDRPAPGSWQSLAPPIALPRDGVRRGRRLTRLGEQACEMHPLWSPDGKWIAFTVVHFDKGYVAPAVCRPDGSAYTELLPPNARELKDYEKMPQDWLPVTPMHPVIGKTHVVLYESGWGSPHIRPVEWSDDGRYLLLARGDLAEGTAGLATRRNGAWYVGDVPEGGRLGMQRFGPRTIGSCLVVGVDIHRPSRLHVVDKLEACRSGGHGRLKTIAVPTGMSIRWLDW